MNWTPATSTSPVAVADTVIVPLTTGFVGVAEAGFTVIETSALLEREPSSYVKSLSPDRFTEKPWDWSEACRQAQAVYETYYGV